MSNKLHIKKLLYYLYNDIYLFFIELQSGYNDQYKLIYT